VNLPPQAPPVRRPGPGRVCDASGPARPAPGDRSDRFEPLVQGGDIHAPQAYMPPDYQQTQDQATL
jgi:hypothetical protein